MKKVFFYLVLTLVSSLVTSCYSDSYMDEKEEKATFVNGATRSNAEMNVPAYIRINMYESVSGYTVEINNVNIFNMCGTMETPSFGKNFEGAVLPTNARNAIFETEDGRYAIVAAGTSVRLGMCFDVKLTSDDGSHEEIRLSGITIALSNSSTVLGAGEYYDATVNVNDSMLNLSAINFGVTVEDYSDNTTES